MAEFTDARGLTLSAPLQADVCIVGAGAAGITIAEQLATRGVDVLLLESGGESIDGATQSLYQCEQSGIPYFDMTACRLRYLGGTTNHWGGYCRENDPIDYLGRPELGVPGWPLRYEKLRPYVVQAAQRLGLKMEGFDPRWQLAQRGIDASQLLDDRSPLLESKVFQLTQKRRFRELHSAALRADPNIRPLLHANVTHIQLDPGARHVTGLVVRTLNGRQFEVRASRYVLAAHAIENARLLLVSNDVLAAGIGNQSDMVGRHFMEHPRVRSGLLFPSERFPRLYDAGAIASTLLNINIGIKAPTMRERGMLQYYCRFLPVQTDYQTADAVKALRAGFWKPADLKAIEALGTLAGDVPASLRYLAVRVGASTPLPAAYKLDHRIEQAPNPDSRITLGTERDALGMRKPVFNWALSDLDYHSLAEGQRTIVEEFTRLGLGRFEAPPIDAAVVREKVEGHYHHIGTARMASSPREGVVDADCRVHGTDNLLRGRQRGVHYRRLLGPDDDAHRIGATHERAPGRRTGQAMKTLLLVLLLPPFVLLLPWTVPLWRGRRSLALAMLGLWLAGWAIVVFVALGPGLALLALLGIGQLLATNIELPRSGA